MNTEMPRVVSTNQHCDALTSLMYECHVVD